MSCLDNLVETNHSFQNLPTLVPKMNASPKRLRDSGDDSSMKKQKIVIPESALSLKFQTKEDENGVIIAENNMTREFLIQYRLLEQMSFDRKVAKLISKDTETITVAEIIAWMEGKTFTEISRALEPVCTRATGIIYTLALRLDDSSKPKNGPLSKDTPIDSLIVKNLCDIPCFSPKIGESRYTILIHFPYIGFNIFEVGKCADIGSAVMYSIVKYNEKEEKKITIGAFYNMMRSLNGAGQAIAEVEKLYPFLKVM